MTLTKEMLEKLEFSSAEITWIEQHGLIGLPAHDAAERLGWLNKYEWSVEVSLPFFTPDELKSYCQIIGESPRKRSDFVVKIMKSKHETEQKLAQN